MFSGKEAGLGLEEGSGGRTLFGLPERKSLSEIYLPSYAEYIKQLPKR